MNVGDPVYMVTYGFTGDSNYYKGIVRKITATGQVSVENLRTKNVYRFKNGHQIGVDYHGMSLEFDIAKAEAIAKKQELRNDRIKGLMAIQRILDMVKDQPNRALARNLKSKLHELVDAIIDLPEESISKPTASPNQ